MIEVGIVAVRREEWVKECSSLPEQTKEEKILCEKAIEFGKKFEVVRVLEEV